MGVSRLRPAPLAASADEQVAQIAASIAEFGWTNPVLVGANGVIIAGHARLAAARKLQMADVPVIVLDHLSETQRRAADNRLSLSAGWDEAMLRVELESLKADDFELDVIGFSDEEIENLLRGPEETHEGLSAPWPRLTERAFEAPAPRRSLPPTPSPSRL